APEVGELQERVTEDRGVDEEVVGAAGRIPDERAVGEGQGPAGPRGDRERTGEGEETGRTDGRGEGRRGPGRGGVQVRARAVHPGRGERAGGGRAPDRRRRVPVARGVGRVPEAVLGAEFGRREDRDQECRREPPTRNP